MQFCVLLQTHKKGDAMKASTKASEASGARPAVSMVAGAGQLRALMWKREGHWQFAIVREDPISGEVGALLTPSDIGDLAVLTSVIATALNEYGQLDDVDLGDDLGCLGHDLARLLGVVPTRLERFPKAIVQ